MYFPTGLTFIIISIWQIGLWISSIDFLNRDAMHGYARALLLMHLCSQREYMIDLIEASIST